MTLTISVFFPCVNCAFWILISLFSIFQNRGIYSVQAPKSSIVIVLILSFYCLIRNLNSLLTSILIVVDPSPVTLSVLFMKFCSVTTG